MMRTAQKTRELPILLLTSAVVFPKEATTLQVHSQRNCTLIEQLPEDGMLVLLPAIDSETDSISPDKLGKVGVAGRVISSLYVDGRGMQLTVEGLQRVFIDSIDQIDPFFRGQVRDAVEDEGNRLENNQLIFDILDLYEGLGGKDARYAKGVFDVLKMNLDEPGEFADLAAKLGYYPLSEKTKVLESLAITDRLRRVRDLLRTDLEKAEVASEVEQRAQMKIEKDRKEYYLRAQLREIQRELGVHATGATEAEEILELAEARTLPDAVRERLRKETTRLRGIEPASSEYEGIRNYTRWLLDLPWNQSVTDDIDLGHVRDALDREHYGLESIKERILEHLAVKKLAGTGDGSVLCFVGPPGTGKTSLGQAIARAMGRKFHRISVGGVTDEAEIRGHRRTYIGSMPGKILQGLAQLECDNPVIVIDEIDKMGKGWRGDPTAALLEVLDPEQNATFVDHYVGLPFDLSRILFIVTANVATEISGPLLDRMEVLRLTGYTESEKITIASRYLAPRVIAKTGLGDDAPTLPRSSWERIIREYTREAGLRGLRRRVETIYRKIATARVLGTRVPKSIRPQALEKYLGPPEIIPERSRRESQVGVATGLAWTPSGGDILTIETLAMRGKGKLIVTGYLGDVMQESVKAAHSYVRSRAELLQIDPVLFEERDIHVHFPDGAVPKDGPSAGVTVTLALASLLSRRPVRHDVAMTGEISLRGDILAIGGVKEKVLAAHRSGIRTVILPSANEKDLADVPDEIRKQMDFRIVATMDQVLEAGILSLVLPDTNHVEHPDDVA